MLSASFVKNRLLSQLVYKQDLDRVYTSLQSGSILCGNKVQDAYVQKVLNWIANKYNLSIQMKGDFWFIAKS